MKIIIGFLYQDLMNIYGDTGNVIVLQKRLEWRGISAEVKKVSIGDNLKKGEIDIFFFGGGQDQAQEAVALDLQKSGKGRIIKEEIEKGVPLLSICGGYQLLGEYYQPHDSAKLPGISLFSTFTQASFDRMIGNIVVDSQFGTLVGFENHSGKTYLKSGATPLGKVVTGFGNNGEDKTEGCIYKNALGGYMHGSLLPKNPQLADWLLEKALETKYQEKITLQKLDDKAETLAHNVMTQRLKKN